MTTRSRYTAAITDKPWWLAGGIPQSACVAAYQAVGASDYASSKINLANPGVYNAIEGAAYPSWNSTAGWIFANKFLDTNYLLPNTFNMTFIARISDYNESAANHQWLFGSNNGQMGIRFRLNATTNVTFINGNVSYNSGVSATAGGVFALVGDKAFHNGSLLSTFANSGAAGGQLFEIGRLTDASYNAYCNIQAFSFYTIRVTDSQVSALTLAMNAL